MRTLGIALLVVLSGCGVADLSVEQRSRLEEQIKADLAQVYSDLTVFKMELDDLSEEGVCGTAYTLGGLVPFVASRSSLDTAKLTVVLGPVPDKSVAPGLAEMHRATLQDTAKLLGCSLRVS